MRIRSLRNRLALLFGADRADRDRDRLLRRRAAARGPPARPEARRRSPTTRERYSRRRCDGWSAPTRRSRSSPARCGSSPRARARESRARRRSAAPRTRCSCSPTPTPAASRSRTCSRSPQTALATGRTARATEPTRLGRQALVAEPLIDGGRVRGVAVFADALTDVQANVSLIRRQILVAGALAFLIAVLARLPRRARAVAARQAPRARRAQGRERRLLRPHRARLRRRARPARRGVRRHAAPARSSSTTRASSSSPRPRTSCARRCSRSAASSSCSRTRSSTTPRAAQFLDQVREQIERLSRLATELLDLSRLEAGALELRTEPTDVGQLARDVAGEFTPVAAQHGSELRVELGARGDRDRVRPRAGGAGGSHPARQRPAAHARGDRASSFRRRARTGR